MLFLIADYTINDVDQRDFYTDWITVSD